MKKASFEQQSEPRWREVEELLEYLEKDAANTEAARLPALFRQVCSDLALAQHRMYGRKLCDRLNLLVVRCYSQLRKGMGQGWENIVGFFLHTFPRAVRKDWRLVAVALSLFWVPFGAMILASQHAPHWVFSVLEPTEIEMMDGMYGENAEPVDYMHKKYGGVGTSFAMFSYYVQHNIGIGLRTFGMGILFMVGALYELAWEGVKLGAMFGYVHYTGNADKIWRFAISHSSFELTGLIICGAAGMKLGLGVLFPGRLPRAEAIARAGREALPLLIGGVFLVFLAAIVEGFWSPTHWIPVEVKYAFGISMWGFWLAYFLTFGWGRRRDA